MADYQDIGKLLQAPFKPRLYCLLKVGREEHLQLLRRGRLFCRPLSFYKKVEGEPLPFQDTHEGLLGIFQAERTEWRFTPRSGPPIIINSDTGLIGEVYVSADYANPVFCLHAIHAGQWSDRTFGQDELDAFKAYVQIPDSMSKFGTHVWVITSGEEFARRLSEACARLNIVYSRGLVRYVDPKQVHGTIPKGLSAFVKRRLFEDEREYRFFFGSKGHPLPDPFILDIGSLEDISQVMSFEDFRKSWAISFPE